VSTLSGEYQSQEPNPKNKSKPKPSPAWKADYAVYAQDEATAYAELSNDVAFIATCQRFHPSLNIPKSLERAHVEYWGTEDGWDNKRKCKPTPKTINWRLTYQRNIDKSPVYKVDPNKYPSETPEERSARLQRQVDEKIAREREEERKKEEVAKSATAKETWTTGPPRPKPEQVSQSPPMVQGLISQIGKRV